MKRLDLEQVEHTIQVGDPCGTIEPNVTEDAIFYADGKPVGFYIRTMDERGRQLAEIANRELRSKRVPKTMMARSSAIQARGSENEGVSQFSTIIGACPPKPHMRRPYATISSVHQVPSANLFIKAMILLAKYSEDVIKELMPEQYAAQLELMSQVSKDWKLTDLFTSSISNYNIPASYHRDTANIMGTVNVIITKRARAIGGSLNVPDYGATIEQADNSLLVYPAWRNVHGVTPIVPESTGGYRNSLVFYPLKAFIGAKP